LSRVVIQLEEALLGKLLLGKGLRLDIVEMILMISMKQLMIMK